MQNCITQNPKRSTFLTKVKSNLWKCYQIRKKNYILTIATILLPVLSFVPLGFGRVAIGESQKTIVSKPTYSEIFSEGDLYRTFKLDIDSSVILYTPETNFTNTLMRKVQLKLELLNHGIKSFPNEEDLLHYYLAEQPKICFAVIFHGLENDSTPVHLDYNIRFNDNNIVWKPNTLFENNDKYIQETGSKNYFQTGFILLQMAIDTNYIDMQNQLNLTFTMQEFPYPPYTEYSDAIIMIYRLLPGLTLFSFILMYPTTLKNIVEEKDSGIKELMKMMGLPTYIMWICWFIEAMLLNVVSVLMIVLCMKADFGANVGVLEHCDPIILGIFLFLYCNASITFCFLISTIINNRNFTTIIGISISVVTYALALILEEILIAFSFELQLFCCIFPNFAMNYGYRIIADYERLDTGLQWTNIDKPAAEGVNELAITNIFAILIFDIFLCMLFAIYIDSINPGKMGVGKPIYYPLTAIKNAIFKNDCPVLENIDDESELKIEKCNSKVCVRIRKLCKVYERSVVNKFSIDFYEGEITAFLGRNGAGKTTILSIISGVVPPTSGAVQIDGHNLEDDLDYIRTLVGVCPQQNLLFSDLTVKNHLKFVAMLNGIKDQEKEINNLLHVFKLYKQRHMFPGELSGGMKRKLCLAMALIKSPKVLILDEPTSGLDTESRREIWDVLNNLKMNFKTNSIIISTHYMDEAEELGNRIAIIDQGTCMNYGTPEYLKRVYVTGINLTIIRNPFSDIDDTIEDLIKRIYMKREIENTKKRNSITYRLDQDTEKLLNLVKNLEEFKENGLIDIMLTNTTIDDVLTCISKQVLQDDSRQLTTSSGISGVLNSLSRLNKCTGFGKVGWTLVKTHFQIVRKLKWSYLLCWIFCLLVTMTLLISTKPSFKYMDYIANDNSMKIDLTSYGNTNVYCSISNAFEDLEAVKHFKKITTSKLGQVIVVDSVSDALIKEGINNIQKYNERAVVAVEFNSTGDKNIINAMYSNNAVHGAPISWNLVANAIAAAHLGQGFLIKTQNTPLPTTNIKDVTKQSEFLIAFLWMAVFPLGLLTAIQIFVTYPYMQRKSNVLQLLHMTGMKKSTFWVALFVFDFILYSILCLLIVLTIYCSNNPIFSGTKEIATFLAILIIYGLLTIPTVYLFSSLKSLSAATNYLETYNLFTGLIPLLIILPLEYSGSDTSKSIGLGLRYIFQLFPENLFTYVMFTFCRKAVWNYNWSILSDNARIIKCRYSPNPCCDTNNPTACTDFQSYTTLLTEDRYQITTSIVLFPTIALLWLTSKVIFHYIASKKRLRDKITNSPLECISFHENSKDTNANYFTVNNLTKCYNKNISAVKGLEFEIEKGTCFGLLGVNGSGKTTTFKLLTGDLSMNEGDACIDDIWLSKNKAQYLSKIGYCPQVDALFGVFTVREMLLLFGNIRGYRNVDKIVDDLICELELSKYSDVLCEECSGGNKRKLSLGISLIVDPEVIMLDEPTCGVDAISRRYLWNYLNNLKLTLNKTMLLTSHSLAECEELCDSVIILSNGKVSTEKTSVSLLKKNNSNIYMVEIKVKNKEAVEKVIDSFIDTFRSEEVQLQNRHLSLVKFCLSRKTGTTHLLQKLEDFKNAHNEVDNYFITMPNLEDIFLNIIQHGLIKNDNVSINMSPANQ